jgi:hypothetical protein
MIVTPTLKLCFDAGDPDFGYWLESSGTYNIDIIHYVSAGNGAFSPTADGEGNYHLVLLLNSNPGNGPCHHPVLHTAVLGKLADAKGSAGIIVDLKSGNQRVGGGEVKLSSAEQTSRPIPFKG